MTNGSKEYTVVGLGELLWDLLPDGKQVGGAPANFAYHAQALGARGAIVSCVGDDALGHEIVERLRGFGLDVDRVAVDGAHPTGTVSVELDGQGKPDYTIHEQVAWDFLPLAPDLRELAKRTDAVCFGSLAQRSSVSRDTILQFLGATPSGCLKVFDINLRQSYFDAATIRASLGLSDVLKLNDEEVPIVADLLAMPGAEPAVLDQLMETYALRMVALTRGERGSLLLTRDEAVQHPGCTPPEMADTVGAGDCFAAAVAMGLLRGDALADVSAQANRLASYVCSRKGATPPMPATGGRG